MKMKTHRIDGSTLVVVLMTTVLLSVAVGAMLQTVAQEYVLTRRNLTWNQTLYTAESAVELGWNELNKQTGINTNGAATFMQGWYQAGTTFTLTNQTLQTLSSAAGTYENSTFTVSVTTNSPTTFAGATVSKYATIVASGTMNSPIIGQALTRNVQVVLAPIYAFSRGAILVKGALDFSGNAATIDSWDSTLSGTNYAGAPHRAHGHINTDGLLINAAGLDLYGSMSTGPGGTNTTSAGFNLFQPVAPDTGVNLFRTDTQVSIPDAYTPFTPPASSGSPATLAGPGDYTITQINGNMSFTGTGTLRVYVNGAITVNGSQSITVAPGLKVELYVVGNITLAGTQETNAEAGNRAGNLLIFGLPTCTSVEVSGNSTTQCAIYAPNADVRQNGGGHEAFFGAIIGKSYSAQGGIDIHYDEALGLIGPILGYTTASWKEY